MQDSIRNENGTAFAAPILLNLRLLHAVTLLELIHASAAVDQLLTTGVEGVALGADLDLELALDGTALEGLTACTANDALAVGRMDVLFHCFLLYFWAGHRPAAELLTM